MLCQVALKLVIPWYYVMNSKVILHVLAMLSCMLLRYQEKVLAFQLHLESEVLPIDVYHIAQHHPTMSHKYD
jgi:hypothetical protein